MKIACLIAQYLLGLGFTVFGLNGFVHFIRLPPPPAGSAATFLGTLAATHYMVVVFGLQLAGGLLLLTNRFVAVALILLGPVLANVLLYHGLMDPKGLATGVVLAALFAATAYRVWPAFAGIFRAAPPVRTVA